MGTPDDTVWHSPAMARALYARDVPAVYRLLTAAGTSQRWIAARTGQSQSEVHDIHHGRAVRSYDLLARIADGLDIPRGRMGLASIPRRPDSGDGGPKTTPDQDEDVKRRELLALASAAAVGATLPEAPHYPEDDHVAALAHAERVGRSDVRALDTARTRFNGLNDRYGAIGQYQAILALWQRAERLTTAPMTDAVQAKLLTVCARLATDAGWAATDTGDNARAQTHFDRAVQLAGRAGQPTQVARALAFAGRSQLAWSTPNHALELFQFGRVAAQRAGSRYLAATIAVHGAQAACAVGAPDMARNLTAVAADQYGAASADDPAQPFGWGDVASARAGVRLALGDGAGAVEDMLTAQRALADEPERQRSRAFRLARLTRAYLGAGAPDEGIETGRAALDAAQQVRSARVLRRLTPVAADLEPYERPESRQLAHDVRTLTGASV